MTERIVNFPDDWYATGEPVDARAYKYQNGPLFIFSAYLSDNTSLYALLHPDGQRFARVRRATNWAVEERYAGRPPRDCYRKEVTAAWRQVLRVARGTAHAGIYYDPKEAPE